MANVLINDQHLKDIAIAIRARANTTETYTTDEMAEAILSIPTPDTTTAVDISAPYINRIYLGAKVTQIPTGALAAYIRLGRLESPATSAAPGALSGCNMLSSIHFPNMVNMDSGLDRSTGARYFEWASFGEKIQNINLSSGITTGLDEQNVTIVENIIIRNTTSIPTLSVDYMASRTSSAGYPQALGDLFLYVPTSMVAQYEGYMTEYPHCDYNYYTLKTLDELPENIDERLEV